MDVSDMQWHCFACVLWIIHMPTNIYSCHSSTVCKDLTCMVSWNHSVGYEHEHSVHFGCCVCVGGAGVVFVSGGVWSGQRYLTLSLVPFVIAFDVYSLEQMFQATSPPLSLRLHPPLIPLLLHPHMRGDLSYCWQLDIVFCALIGSSVVLS